MKSPWKMIGQLIFRGRPLEEAQELADAGQPRVPDEQETFASSLSPVRRLVERQLEDVKLGGKTALGAAESDDGVPLPNPVAVDHVATRSAKKPNHGRAQKSKKETKAEIAGTPSVTRPRRGGRQKVEAAAGRETSTKSARDDIHAEVADVDAEIRALARQLAEKLRQQNAQLHKMLERFGGPDS